MSRRIGYAELYFTDEKCPAFGVPEYQTALEWFNKIADLRNF